MNYGAERAVAQYLDKIVNEARAAERRKAALAFRNIRARLAEHDMPIHVAADIEQIICEDGGDFGACTVPPTGWWCSREAGHEGPCAATPTLHVCEECQTCGVHGNEHLKCCGCYDGVCCQESDQPMDGKS